MGIPLSQRLLFLVPLFLQVNSMALPSRFPSPMVANAYRRELDLTSTGVDENRLGGLNLETNYFTQQLDHFNFNPESYQTFQQRYLVRREHWGGPHSTSSPIFVYMGNEGDIEWFARNTGLMHQIAPLFQALLVFIEHRYYGKSMPYGGRKEEAYKNASTQGYLSSAQALADYATLILDLKRNLSALHCPVVVFGGSYGGMLAAWFRLKYPHVAAGALSSSSPILYFDHLTSPFSFSHIVSTDFRSESENCYKTIKSSWNRIEDTAKQPGGLHLLLRSFRICKSDSITVDTVTNWIRTAYVYTAMTDYPTASNFLRPLPAYPVKQMCAAIDEPRSEDTFAKVYGAVNIYYNYSGSVKDCFDLETPSDQHGLDEWTWQACTEMVMLTGGDNEESMFPTSPPDDYDSWVSSCQLMYDIQPRPHWITTEFGAHDIRRVLRRYGSNIIFFNGLRDPWSSGGVRSNISDTIVAIVAEKGAHHVDLRFSTKEDPEWLRQVRESEITIIKKWLDEYYFDLANFPSQ